MNHTERSRTEEEAQPPREDNSLPAKAAAAAEERALSQTQGQSHNRGRLRSASAWLNHFSQ